jgi:hypothetical protein
VSPRRLAAVLAVTLAAGCGDSTGPTGGELVVTLTSTSTVRAVQFRLVGPAEGITAPPGSGFVVYAAATAGDTMAVAIVAATGATLPSGPIARVQVPDVGQVTRYSAAVVQLAGPSYAILSPAGTSLKVGRL